MNDAVAICKHRWAQSASMLIGEVNFFIRRLARPLTLQKVNRLYINASFFSSNPLFCKYANKIIRLFVVFIKDRQKFNLYDRFLSATKYLSGRVKVFRAIIAIKGYVREVYKVH